MSISTVLLLETKFVFSYMIIGVSKEVIAGEGKIVTAGAIDCHVHFICPQLAYEAIASGKITCFLIENVKS